MSSLRQPPGRAAPVASAGRSWAVRNVPTAILQMDEKPPVDESPGARQYPLPGTPQDDTTRSPLTPEARALVEKAARGGVPLYTTANLVRIAEENGISVSPDMTPNQVIDELRRRGRPGDA